MSERDDSGPVTVFRTNDPGLLAVAQSLLEDADIEFFVAGQAVSGLYPGGATGPYGVPEIRVAAQNADEARELLKELTSGAGLTPRDVPAEEMPGARSPLPYVDAQEDQIEDHLELNDADGPATTPRLSRRSFGIIVGSLGVCGIALAVALSQTGNVLSETVDLTRARFAIGIVEESGGTLRLVNPDQSLSERDVASANLSVDEANRLAVSFVFTDAGAAKLETLTTTNVGKQMGFVSRSGEVLTAATIEAVFSSDAQITFPTSDEAQAFVNKLQSAVK